MSGRFPLAGPENDKGLALRRFITFILPIAVIVLAIVGNGIMGALREEPEKNESDIKAAPVLVAQPVQETVRLSIQTQGEVQPRTEISLVPQVSGNIAYMSDAFIEGGAFKKGDLLLQVEQRDYKLRVVQARANVAQARTRLTSEQAESDIARRDWEELGQKAEDLSPLALREPQLDEARAALASAEAALDEAELALERTSIRAPFDGRVRRAMADFGQYITPGTPLGEIFSDHIMEVPLPLTDGELGQLGLNVGFNETETVKGPEVTLTATVAGRPREWTGRIVRTDSGYDPSTRVLFGYVEVEDPYGAGADDGTPLAPGLFVTVNVQGRSVSDSMVLPRTALRGNDKVYVAKDDNTLEIRTVNVASSDRERVILAGGLTGDERIVTSPVTAAADGMKIEIVDPTAEEAEPEEDVAAKETSEVAR
jgi:RND family efflux transporter MFP subunit